MEDLDLNKYQLAWKKEKSFQAEILSEIEIQNFMKSASKIVGHYKRSLLFDIGFKYITHFISCINFSSKKSIKCHYY